MILLCLFALFLILSSSTESMETSTTGCVFLAIYSENGETKEIREDAIPARFGIPDYNGNKRGRVRILEDTGNEYGCEAFEPSTYWDDWNSREDSIVLVQRGECEFVKKVKNAQEAGFGALLLQDYEGNDNAVRMSAPEAFVHGTLTISAAAITHGAGVLLANAVKSQQVVIGSIEWHVPLSNNKARLELFTSSTDAEDMDFKRNFRNLAKILNQAARLEFIPVYYVEDGAFYGCRGSTTCGDQCANTGRYCFMDPDHRVSFGISGYDVVRENLVQMCVYRFSEEHPDAISHEDREDIWWTYVSNFDEACVQQPTSENGDHKFHLDCSRDQLDRTSKHFGWSSDTMWNFVNQCQKDTGFLGQGLETDNTILEKAIADRSSRDIQLLPSFAINGFETHGSWDCPENPSVDNCNIFKALCAAYVEEEKPDVCDNDVGCPAGLFRDQCGDCKSRSRLPLNSGATCQQYLNANDASKGSVIAIYIILFLIAVALVYALYILWKKHEEHEVVITETKKYISMDDSDLQIGRPGIFSSGYGKVANTGLARQPEGNSGISLDLGSLNSSSSQV